MKLTSHLSDDRHTHVEGRLLRDDLIITPHRLHA